VNEAQDFKGGKIYIISLLILLILKNLYYSRNLPMIRGFPASLADFTPLKSTTDIAVLMIVSEKL
jgi:hypothetical protein